MKQKEYNKDTEIDYAKLIYTFPPLYAKSAAEKQRFLLCVEKHGQKTSPPTVLPVPWAGICFALNQIRRKTVQIGCFDNPLHIDAVGAVFLGQHRAAFPQKGRLPQLIVGQQNLHLPDAR